MSQISDYELQKFTYKQIDAYSGQKSGVASQIVKTGAGTLGGFICSLVGGTIKLWDNTSAATTVLISTFTPAAQTMYNLGNGVDFGTGLYVTFTGSVVITFFYR